MIVIIQKPGFVVVKFTIRRRFRHLHLFSTLNALDEIHESSGLFAAEAFSAHHFPRLCLRCPCSKSSHLRTGAPVFGHPGSLTLVTANLLIFDNCTTALVRLGAEEVLAMVYLLWNLLPKNSPGQC